MKSTMRTSKTVIATDGVVAGCAGSPNPEEAGV